MKLCIAALVGMLAMLMVWIPRPVASEPRTVQPQVISTEYLSPGESYGYWIRACRDPRYRRHHPFLCW
jgi:hypothetical protein